MREDKRYRKQRNYEKRKKGKKKEQKQREKKVFNIERTFILLQCSIPPVHKACHVGY